MREGRGGREKRDRKGERGEERGKIKISGPWSRC